MEEEINFENVINYSEHWKKIVIEKGEKEKGEEALKLLEKIEYIKKTETEKGYYLIDKTFKIINNKCSCNEEECSHLLAFYLQLKIWNNQKKLKTDVTII